MRHRKAGIKLNRTASHRDAMFRNMVTSLFKHDRLRTTDVKAKELRRWADRMVTLAKRGDLHARRQVLAVVREKAVVHRLFATAQERFGSRNGGYTRLIKLGRRPGDAAAMTLIELVATQPAGRQRSARLPSAPAVEPKRPAAATDASDLSQETAAVPSAPADTDAEAGSTQDAAQAETAAGSDDQTAVEAAAATDDGPAAADDTEGMADGAGEPRKE